MDHRRCERFRAEDRRDFSGVAEAYGFRWWSGLTKKQTTVLEQIEKKPEISRKELARILGINPSAVQKHIQGLKDKSYIRRIGPDKGGHWEVIGK